MPVLEWSDPDNDHPPGLHEEGSESESEVAEDDVEDGIEIHERTKDMSEPHGAMPQA